MNKSIFDIKFKFKKIQNKYYFELCCNDIVNVYNDCPSSSIGFIINKCFKINDIIYYSKNLIIGYINLTTGFRQEKILINLKDNCQIPVHINTDQIIKNNKICIKQFKLEVVPKCIKSLFNITNYCNIVCLGQIVNELVPIPLSKPRQLKDLLDLILKANSDAYKIVEPYLDNIKEEGDKASADLAAACTNLDDISNEAIINDFVNIKTTEETAKVTTATSAVESAISEMAMKQAEYDMALEIAEVTQLIQLLLQHKKS
jgi:hypothetical protein